MNKIIKLIDEYLALGLTQAEAVRRTARQLEMTEDEVLMQAVGYTPN